MHRGIASWFLGLALLCGCAQQTTRQPTPRVSVVVVPASSDGHVGAVAVRPIDGGKPVVVDKPFVEVTLEGARSMTAAAVQEKDVEAQYAEARKALPAPPVSYLVYFVEGTDELNPAAKRVIDDIATEVESRPSAEIIVIGHTDFVGTDKYNDKLSLQRAQRVKVLLVRRGIHAKSIEAAGRGRREPMVEGDERKAQPRNRRVEITVR